MNGKSVSRAFFSLSPWNRRRSEERRAGLVSTSRLAAQLSISAATIHNQPETAIGKLFATRRAYALKSVPRANVEHDPFRGSRRRGGRRPRLVLLPKRSLIPAARLDANTPWTCDTYAAAFPLEHNVLREPCSAGKQIESPHGSFLKGLAGARQRFGIEQRRHTGILPGKRTLDECEWPTQNQTPHLR